MVISETCEECGAERPSWLGSSHYGKDYYSHRHHVRLCEDGKTPEDLFIRATPRASWAE